VESGRGLLDERGQSPEPVDHLLAFAFPASRSRPGLDFGSTLGGFGAPAFDFLFEDVVNDAGPLAGDLNENCGSGFVRKVASV
jgi:hypothetical protein